MKYLLTNCFQNGIIKARITIFAPPQRNFEFSKSFPRGPREIKHAPPAERQGEF